MIEPLKNRAIPIEKPYHGGNLEYASLVHGEPEGGWIDLSTGINPSPYPFSMPPQEIFARLPDESQRASLIRVAKQYYSSTAGIVLGAGSQAFIQILPEIRRKGRIGVLSPTYSEHRRTWSKAGHDIFEISTFPDNSKFDVLIVVNPNNPDGRRFAAKFLIDIAKKQHERGGWLIVDEAFCDTDPTLSVAPFAKQDGLIVLRSFGKFFGLAGLRLGFAICNFSLSIELQHALGPWAVSGPALHIGRQALLDKEWHKTARKDLRDRRRRIDSMLLAAGYKVVGGTDLFRLIGANGARLNHRLAEYGIWTRLFDFSADFLRIGLPRDEIAWARVERALK